MIIIISILAICLFYVCRDNTKYSKELIDTLKKVNHGN